MWLKSLSLSTLVLSGVLGLVDAAQQPLRAVTNPGRNQTGWNGKVVQPTNSSTASRFASGHESYDQGLFTPLGDLSVLSETAFTRVVHPAFPRHGVRIKKTRFCDGTVNAYTGYIDVEARHIFFYFFESRNDPANDDVIFWTNGGPGGSSSIGLFFELGPCRIPDDNGPVFHPESWNNNASVIFVDQPVDVGFSYADYGEEVTTTPEGAKDISAFLAIFFENFKQFQGNGLHMAGESYGGRYIPLYAAAVYDQNARLVEAGMTPINLTSVAIGNGITDPWAIILSYYDMTCTSATVPPVLDISTCVRMKQVLPRCKKMIQRSCIDVFDGIGCNAAWEFCDQELAMPYFSAGWNPYDISKKCGGKLEETLCYPEAGYVNKYLDRPEVREMLGVDPAVPEKLPPFSKKVNTDFIIALDHLHASNSYITGLLERGVQVLIYVGTYDFACNWIGNERWTLALGWTGHDEFAAQELKEWYVDGKRAGLTRKAKGLMFATIEGAGHMAPYDKPKESLALINRWMYQGVL